MSQKPRGFDDDSIVFDDDSIVFDDDNPEWTAEDFKKARPASELPPEILAAFPKMRGAQKAPTKEAVSIRLSSEVLDHYRATGKGWQTRIDDALKDLIKKAG